MIEVLGPWLVSIDGVVFEVYDEVIFSSGMRRVPKEES